MYARVDDDEKTTIPYRENGSNLRGMDLNVKNRIKKLESDIKPKQPSNDWDLSVLSNEELYRLEYLVVKNETGLTPDEYRELKNLHEKCKKEE